MFLKIKSNKNSQPLISTAGSLLRILYLEHDINHIKFDMNIWRI